MKRLNFYFDLLPNTRTRAPSDMFILCNNKIATQTPMDNNNCSNNNRLLQTAANDEQWNAIQLEQYNCHFKILTHIKSLKA